MRGSHRRQSAWVAFGLLVAVGLAYWAGSSTFAQAPGGEERQAAVGLRSRALNVPPDRGQALRAVCDIPPGLRRHVIVQFDGIPTAEERQELELSGIVLVEYLQNHAWYASVAGGLAEFSPALERVRASWSIEPADRLAPRLRLGDVPAHAVGDDGRYALTVLAFEDADLEALQAEVESHGGEVSTVSAPFFTLFLRVPPHALAQIAGLDGIEWIEPAAPAPSPEMNRARVYLNTDLVQAAPYSLTGAGIDVSVHDDGHAFRHNDFYSRWVQGDASAGETLSVAGHPSWTAGTIVGDGTGNALFKGMAPGATVVTYSYNYSGAPASWESNNYADIVLALQRGVEVANNSWGWTGCGSLPWGDYTSQARIFDREVLGLSSTGVDVGNPTVVVFSAGNERYNTACVPIDTAPFANYSTINQPKPAKNPIAVGGVDSYNNLMSAFSSWGPTSDGRLKPDIVAPALHNGTNTSGVSSITNPFGTPVGSENQQDYRATHTTNTDSAGTSYDDRYAWFAMTSASAAMVSGNAALFIQDFKARNGGAIPAPSMVKAHFIHTARDLNDSTSWYNPGPDYASGYGSLDIKGAIDQLRSGGWAQGCVVNGETDNFTLAVPAGATQAKFTLVWDDVPGAPATTAPALVNDLDLVVTDASGTRRYPWTLNPASPSASAVRTVEDHRNNVEMVLADGTVPSGTWQINVRGTTVPTGPQCYSLVWSPVAAPSLPVVSIVASDPTATESPLTTGTFTLTRTGSVAAALTIGWTASGTATLASGDRLALPTNPVIPAGSASTTVTVTPVADGVVEPAETVIMTLKTSAAYTIDPAKASATVTITDGVPVDKPVVTIVATDATATESPLTTGAFTLYRTGSVAAPLTIGWTASGTATLASGDRLSLPTNPVIPAGSASTTVLVTPIADGVAEPAETVILTLKTSTAYTVGSPNSATVTITDGVPVDKPVVTITASDPTATEVPLETGAFTLCRTGSPAAALTIGWTASGTATLASGDRLSLPTNPVIPAGSACVTILVTPIADGVVEPAETVIMTLKTSTAYTVGSPNSATVTITDGVPVEKPVVTIVASDSWATESPLTTGAFTLTRTGSTTGPLTIGWTASGTATLASGDRLSLPTNPVIPAGSASTTVIMTPIADGVAEPAETVILTLKTSTAYTVGTPNSATVTITDGGPDLVVSSLTGPTLVERGATVTYSEVTRNSGTATAGASVTEYYLSTNTIWDRMDLLISERSVPVLAAGEATRPFLTTFTVPVKMETGTYYLIAVADANRAVTELSETNNTRYLKIAVK